MIISDRRKPGPGTLGLRIFLSRNRYKLFIFGIVLLLAGFAVVVLKYKSPIGKELSHSNWPKEDLENKNVKALLPYIFGSLKNKIQTTLNDVDAPTIFVDVKFKHFRKLNEARKKVVAKGFALDEDRTYVPATIRYGGTKSKMKMRLKGDILDHYDTERWSFRIKMKGNGTIFGMRTFSVQEPERRGFSAEAVFFAHLKQYDILVPRYFFVNLVFNGQPWGVMAIEEVPSKKLLENSRRRESVIFHYDDTANWQSAAAGSNKLSKYYQNHRSAEFVAYGMKKIIKNPELHRLYLRGKSLLEGWRDGRLKTSDVFDVERWSIVIALSEIWHSKHQLKYHNLRFYFNPVVEKFEPVVYDRGRVFYNDANRPSDLLITRDVAFINQLRQDADMRRAFETALVTVANDIVSNRVIDKIRPLAGKIAAQLIHDKFYLMDFPFDTLASRSKALLSRKHFRQQRIVSPRYDRIEARVFPSLGHGLFYRTSEGIAVEISNKLPHRIWLCGLELDDPGNKIRKSLFSPAHEQKFEFSAAPMPRSNLTKRTLLFALPVAEKLALSRKTTVTACLKTDASDQPVYETFFEAAPPIRHSIAILDAQLTAASLSNRFPFMTKISENEVSIMAGVWQLNEPLIIPADVSLKVSAGATLKMAPGVVIVVHGPTQFEGTAANPIILEAANDNLVWNGVVVLHDNSDQSIWRHVVIKDTDRPHYLGWTTTGAVTFHRGSVDLTDVSIRNTRAEDALNVISANISISRVNIEGARSDGFDCDFCQGNLDNLRVSNIGGDGYDVSGSRTKIENSVFKNIKDKAISVGERSNLSGSKIDIENAGFAVVSKDGSAVKLDNVGLVDIRNIGFMAYKKKSEYDGTEEIHASGVVVKGDFQLARSSNGTTVVINGKTSAPENMDVEKLYSSGPMRKN
jgi:hypothetical protein